ncbi:NUDIX hydrolase [Cytophagales bacterium LB-30]|uniref:NUDIX hydrolase n=1 Tax=Shiella aurantiaca TaxID=3058365 RepID=A0ABT8F4C6_9BACT|nr:NUDIX hydrolase [Shiella aurantiaca]MDN4165307.1 NUDIX hydrolase [Shiella aurantiaca]
MQTKINQIFGKKLRTRIVGLLFRDDGLLLINHQGLHPSNVYWAPPGGSQHFGESAIECLQREFKEETHLEVAVKEFLFVHEYRSEHLHAMELFFRVEETGGSLQLGSDPELPAHEQMLSELRLFSADELNSIPNEQKHQMFRAIHSYPDLLARKGYFAY